MSAPDRSQLLAQFLRNAERLNIGLCLMLVVTVHLLSGTGPMLYGAAAGAVVNLLNFRVIAWLGGRLMRAKQRSVAAYMGIFLLKMMALMAAVWLVLSNLPVTPLAFLLGLATFLPAIFLTTLGLALRPAAARSSGSSL